jgi:hypothetical protein
MTSRDEGGAKSKKKLLPTLTGPRVPQEIIDKVPVLTRQVRPLGHPRAHQEDVVGALIDAATPEATAAALTAYNLKLGKALAALDDEPATG